MLRVTCVAFEIRAKQFRLTPREVQVLRLSSRGNTWKIIADTLEIHWSTVRFHLRNVCLKTATETPFAAFTKICGI
jgi:DNA-binding NarL/FixJ family response regulator